MGKIELNSRDLELRTIPTGKYAGSVVVGIKPAVAFDESFIEDMKAAGVREAQPKNEEE